MGGVNMADDGWMLVLDGLLGCRQPQDYASASASGADSASVSVTLALRTRKSMALPTSIWARMLAMAFCCWSSLMNFFSGLLLRWAIALMRPINSWSLTESSSFLAICFEEEGGFHIDAGLFGGGGEYLLLLRLDVLVFHALAHAAIHHLIHTRAGFRAGRGRSGSSVSDGLIEEPEDLLDNMAERRFSMTSSCRRWRKTASQFVLWFCRAAAGRQRRRPARAACAP